MADLNYTQYVKAQTNRNNRVDEIMASGLGDKKAHELDYAQGKFLDTHMRNIIRLGRILDNNHKHWDQWYKEHNIIGRNPEMVRFDKGRDVVDAIRG